MTASSQLLPGSDATDYTKISFIVAAALANMQTVSVCKVVAVNTGALTVDVQVLVNLMTGGGTSIPHGVISARPYYRAQGGSSGIILDPVAGDIGLLVFGSRDLSGVIAAKGAANPGSQRQFDWADGLYIGGILNTTPTQYLQFAAGGITLKSPTAVTIQSLNNTVAGPLEVTGNTTLDQNLTVDGTSLLQGAVTATISVATGVLMATTVDCTNLAVSGGTVSLPAGSITSADLSATGVTAGSYTSTNLTVDAAGRITAASNGSGGGGTLTVTDGVHTVAAVTSLTVSGGTVGGTTPNATLTIAASGGTVTSVGISTPGVGVVVGGGPIIAAGTLTVDLSSTAYAALALATTALQSISIATGTGLAGGPLTASGTTVSLANTAVTPGSYTSANITVDAQGRLTAASNGSSGPALPGTISGLQLWWESDDILGASGSTVSRFRERTPWVTGVLGTAGSTPTTVSGITVSSATLNGLPILKWPAAVNSGVIALLGGGFDLTQGSTFFVVINPGANTSALQCIIGGATGSMAFYLQGVASTAKFSLVNTGTAVIGSSTTAWAVGTPLQANATYLPGTGAYAFRMARAAAGSGTGGVSGGSGKTAWVGADTGPSAPLNLASMAALIVYNRVLSGPEIASIEAYLLAKWGV